MTAPPDRDDTEGRRVLIAGSTGFDSVGESYFRTLCPSYDCRICDPTDPIGADWCPWRGAGPSSARSGLRLLTRALLREPHAVGLRRLLRLARRHLPEIVLITQPEGVPPGVVRELRRISATTILGVFSDHLANFDRGCFFVSDYDALFFKDRYVVEKLRQKLGWKHVWYLPQACDPAIHHPVEITEEERRRYACDIGLYGSTHYYRAAQLSPFLGRDMKIWGGDLQGWFDHPIRSHLQREYLTGSEKCKAMTATRVVLNCNHFAEIGGTNKRTFEVAAIGAFQITDTPALSDVFDAGTEVASFSTREEMIEKISYFLGRPDLRTEMSRKACERAHQEHTYAHRWVAKLAAVGVSVPPGFPVRVEDLRVRAA